MISTKKKKEDEEKILFSQEALFLSNTTLFLVDFWSTNRDFYEKESVCLFNQIWRNDKEKRK